MYVMMYVSMSIRWNEKQAKYFNSAKGLRQRDPIFPYLFVLCMDKLSHMIMDSVKCGQWKGIKAVGRCLVICIWCSHMTSSYLARQQESRWYVLRMSWTIFAVYLVIELVRTRLQLFSLIIRLYMREKISFIYLGKK